MSQGTPAVRDERGAVSSLVVMVFATFVITGMLAWSVDAGQVVWERRQTQNAADAAAFALAQSCAKNNCVPNADSLPALVNANTVNFGARSHAIERQCVANWPPAAAEIPPLTLCNPLLADVQNLRECPPLASGVSTSLPYVEVRVRANHGGAEEIPNPFSRLNPDPAAPATSDVISCSRAAWGIPVSGAFTSPITISTCEWQTYTASGLTYVADPPVAPWPGYGSGGQPVYPPAATTPNTPGRELIIELHDPAKPGCSYNGKDTAGGFGYLDTTGDCSSTITTTNGTDYWANIDTGASATGDCQTALANIWANGPVIDLPVFDCMVKSTTGTPTGAPPADCDPADAGGANTYYHVAGIAKFYLSGYRIGGSVTRPSRVSGAVPCANPKRCISGWFVRGVLTSATSAVIAPSPSAPGFGVSAVIAAG